MEDKFKDSLFEWGDLGDCGCAFMALPVSGLESSTAVNQAVVGDGCFL